MSKTDEPIQHSASISEDNDSPHQMPRRDFLKLAWGSMAIAAGLGSGYIGLRFLESRVADEVFGSVIVAGMVDDFPPGTVTAFNEGQFYLVRMADGGFLALYRKCTHLDCVVLWNERENQFNCPCHGSKFEQNGAVLNPPAPDPLVHFPIEIELGRISVDTGQLIERKKTSVADLTYPEETEI